MPLFHSVHTAGGRFVVLCLYFANVVSMVWNAAALVVGMWVAVTKQPYDCIVGTRLYVSVSILLMVFGILSLANCFLLVYAVRNELRVFIYAYSAVMSVLFVMQLITGVMGFVFEEQMEKSLNFEMISTLKHYYGVEDTVTTTWDRLQSEFKCCGIDDNSTMDLRLWQTSKWYISSQAESKNCLVPASCCVTKPHSNEFLNIVKCQHMDVRNPDPEYVHVEACYNKLHNSLLQAGHLSGFVGITDSLIMLIPAALAVWVARLIQK